MSDDLMKQLSEQFEQFVKNIFGEETVKKINEVSAQTVKNLVEFGDKLIKDFNLDNNELVKKSQENIKELLKKSGLLKEEESEEDDF